MKDYSLKSALDEMLNKTHWSKRLLAVSIKSHWEDIMGKAIAQNTSSLFLERKKLIIRTRIAPLRVELSMNKEAIIEKVNLYYGREIISEVEVA